MSIQNEINRINQNVANTYSALRSMGATLPETQNSDNLASAVRTIPQSGGGEDEVVWVNCTCDLATMQIIYISHTYEELAPLIGKKVIKVAFDYGVGMSVGELGAKNGTYSIIAQIMLRSNLGAGANLYFISLSLYADNSTSIEVRVVDSLVLGG